MLRTARCLLLLSFVLTGAADRPAPAAQSALGAFFTAALRAAPSDFVEVRGTRLPGAIEAYGSTLPADASLLRNCVIGPGPLRRWSVTCTLDAADGPTARALVNASLPAEFAPSSGSLDFWTRWDGASIGLTVLGPHIAISVMQGDAKARAPAATPGAKRAVASLVTTMLPLAPSHFESVRGAEHSDHLGYAATVSTDRSTLSDCALMHVFSSRRYLRCTLVGFTIAPNAGVPASAQEIIAAAVPAGFRQAVRTPKSAVWRTDDDTEIAVVPVDDTVAVVIFEPDPMLAAKPVAPDVSTSLRTFLTATLPLATSDFGGSTADGLSAAGRGVVSDCKVGTARVGGYVQLTCAFASGVGSMAQAAKAVGTVIPPEFRLVGTTAGWTWVRESDYLQVGVNGFCALQSVAGQICISIAQTVKPETTILDGNVTPVPIVWRQRSNGVQRPLGGVVIDQDATRSYVLAPLDASSGAPALADIFLVGSPFGAGLWHLQAATLEHWDAASELAVLAVPKLRIAPATLDTTEPLRGQALRVLFSQGLVAFLHYDPGAGKTITTQTQPSIVGAVHASDGILEYSNGSPDTGSGALIVSGDPARVVGISTGAVAQTIGAYQARTAAAIARAAALANRRVASSGSATTASSDALAGLYARLRPVVARIVGTELGSGVVIGHTATETEVLTAAHVVRGATQISVALPATSNAPVRARIIACGDARASGACSPGSPDLALIAIPKVAVAPATFAAGVERASSIVVLGFPHAEYTVGAAPDLNPTEPKLDRGVVNAVDPKTGTFDHDATTDQGNSGGPVFDLAGGLAGIVEGTPSIGAGSYTAIDLDAIRTFLQRSAALSANR